MLKAELMLTNILSIFSLDTNSAKAADIFLSLKSVLITAHILFTFFESFRQLKQLATVVDSYRIVDICKQLATYLILLLIYS